jgi:CO/xanthine dehydrogenase FAD-binding subunit
MTAVEYRKAESIDDALALVAGDVDVRVVAGGSDLVVGARQGKAPLPGRVVAIHGLDDLRGIEAAADELRLGALVTHAELVDDPAVRSGWSALADAAALVGSHATRNVGTVGGNLMNGSPAMETGGPLVVLGGVVELRSAGGSRHVPVEEMWTGPGRTVAEAGELCTAITVPAPPARSGSAYVRLEYRRAMEIAVVGASAMVTLDGDGAVTQARVALTALAPTIIRSPAAEAALTGSAPDDAVLDAVAAGAAGDAQPISDLRAPEQYRRAMAGVIARRAVVVAVARARGEAFPIPATQAFI